MSRRYKYTILSIAILLIILLQVGPSFALPSNPLEIRIDAPADVDFFGYTADINEEGKVSVHTFTDPGVYAAINGSSVDEVLNYGAENSSSNSESANSNAPKKQANKISGKATFRAAATHQAKVTCVSQILDSVNIVMNELYQQQTFNYDFSYVTWASGSANAYWLTTTGWYKTAGPTLTWGNSLPARSESLKAYASYKNSSVPGGPYENAIVNYTYTYSDGSVNASHVFYVDPKGANWLWKTKGWHNRTQVY